MAQKANLLFAESNDALSANLIRSISHLDYDLSSVRTLDALASQLRIQTPTLLLVSQGFENDGLAACANALSMCPNLAIVVYCRKGSVSGAVAAIKSGACDYLTLPAELPRLHAVVESVKARNQVLKTYLPSDAEDRTNLRRPIIGTSSVIKEVLDKLDRVAHTDATVLLTGESGTGKELFAQELHYRSQRNGSFIPVNLAALTPSLAESRLFGLEKGTFAGADGIKKGCCERADQGTLFLDEIGEMELSLQPKLLRFLQEQTIDRVGSDQSIQVNVRVVAATNRSLDQMLKSGEIRKDLFYRLNTFPIELPPLRARREDIPDLANWFLTTKAARIGKSINGFTPDAMDLLIGHDWPGNIRQLENAIHRSVIMCREMEVTADLLPPEIVESQPALDESFNDWQPSTASNSLNSIADGRTALACPTGKLSRIEQIERQAIIAALDKCGGHAVRAAELLGFGQATIYRKIKLYNISK